MQINIVMCSQKPYSVRFKYVVLFGLASIFVNNVNSDLLSMSEPDVADRISFKKCTEYQKLCSSEPSPFNMDGEEAAAKEFPHMALISHDLTDTKENFWHCAGTLISENFILTAAQCVRTQSDTVLVVRLGDLHIDTEEDDAEVREFNVTESFIHPEAFLRRQYYNDIALLKLDRTVDFSPYIQPACLPHLNTVISHKVMATGWGKTSTKSRLSTKLQKVPLNYVPFDECKENYQPSFTIRQGISNEKHLCAGSQLGERDACAGFGGGPLLNTGRKFSCLYEIVGISSLGKACGSGDPGVYTRVTSYIDWIESIVWPEQ